MINKNIYSVYNRLILEKNAIEAELNYQRFKLDKMSYSGVKDVSSPSLNQDVKSSLFHSKDIKTFFSEFVSQLKFVVELESILKELNKTISIIENKVIKFSQKFNDLEIKVFIKHFIEGKPLNKIYISKSNGEWYSYKQILRTNAVICKKIKEN